MKYYRDKDGDIWEFTSNKLTGIYYVANDYVNTPGWTRQISYPNSPGAYQEWKLTPITKAEVFIEIL